MPTMTTTKYGAKPFWWNSRTQQKQESKTSEFCTYWDSCLEFSIYQSLLRLYPESSIERQVSIATKPATINYPEQSWKCDFRILDPVLGHYNLEVKGAWICSDSAAKADFRKTLMMLDTFNLEEYLKLIIVSDRWFRLDKKVRTIKINELQKTLQEIRERWNRLKNCQ